MREYKIYKTNLGYSIYRKKYVGKILVLQFLNGYNLRTPNKDNARTFYNQDSAVSTLVVVKCKGDCIKETSKETSEHIQEKYTEKQSRSEF